MQNTLPTVSAPGWLNVLEYGFRPAKFAKTRGRSYGRAYRMRGGVGELIVTTDPVHVRNLMAANSHAFESMSADLPWLFGPTSVLVTSGDAHRRQRKLLSPPLTGPRLAAFGRAMAASAQGRIDELQPGQEILALDLATDFALDVILRSVFGVETEGDSKTLRRILTRVVDGAKPSLLFFPWLRSAWYPTWASFQRRRKEYEDWVREEIARRRPTASSRDDVLSLLIEARYDDGSQMTDQEISDQLIGLLLVGHETTAIAIATTLDHIHHAPDVLTQVRAEVAAAPSPEAAQRLTYLSAVIDETLRLNTVVTDLTRVAKVPFQLDENTLLEPGDMVMVLVEGLHADPEVFPEPELFRPERFLTRKYSPYEYMPFGGGVRRCIGAAFSDYETKIFLSMLLNQVELEPLLPKLDRRVRRNITMGPKRGVPMRVKSVRGESVANP